MLTDPAVTYIRESSATLGSGFRCGFLGMLHMDVFKQRLEDEFSVEAILTSPSVPYKCKIRREDVGGAPFRKSSILTVLPMLRKRTRRSTSWSPPPSAPSWRRMSTSRS